MMPMSRHKESARPARARKRVSVLRLFVALVSALLLAACSGDAEVSSCEREPLVLESGVEVVDLECGSGTVAESGQSVEVRYRATLEDGTEFDSTERLGSPYTFRLGAGQVIDGLDEGLVNMRVGGSRRVTVPSESAYGNVGLPPRVPPEATVVFEVELEGVAEPTL